MSDEIDRPEVVPGERIFLSQVRKEDVPLFARWFSDLELTAYVGALGMSFTPEQEQQWYDGLAAGDQKLFAIVVREGRRLIGTVALSKIDHRHGTAELGIAIGDREAWGQGYGSETVRLMADYGLSLLGLHNVCLWYASYNPRGGRAYEKAGFRECGRIHGAILVDGQRYDKVLMEATREALGPSRVLRLIRQIQG